MFISLISSISQKSILKFVFLKVCTEHFRPSTYMFKGYLFFHFTSPVSPAPFIEETIFSSLFILTFFVAD